MNGDFLGVDPELRDLFPGEPDLLDLANRIREGRPEAPQVDRFQAELRARLMAAAPARLHPRGLRRLLGARTGLVFAGAFATVGAAMIAVVVVSTLHSSDNGGVEIAINASARIAGETRVDPNQSITIDFNQPMDQQSVARAIHIQPATSFTTSWTGNTVTIKPVRALAASTGYTVRIEPTVARAQNPAVQPLARPIVVSFGTGPAPTPTPAPAPPVLPIVVLGPAGPAGGLVAGEAGSVLAGDAPTPPPASPQPSASPSSSPPSATEPPSPSPSPTPVAPALVGYGPGGSAVVLGPATQALAVAPGGRSLAAVVAIADGGAEVVLSGIDGSGRRVLTTRADPGSPLAWTQNARLIFVGSGRLRTVDLNGAQRDLGVAVAPGQTVLLSPDGRHAVLGPVPPAASTTSTPAATASPASSSTPSPQAPGATLIDLGDVSRPPVPLPGAATLVAFSGDGQHLAWLDTAADAPLLQVLTIAVAAAPAAPTPLHLPAGPDAVTALALSQDGSRVAVASGAPTASAPGLVVVDSASSNLLGTEPGRFDHLVFASPTALDGVRRATSGDSVAVITLPAPSTSTTTPAPTVPKEADALLDRLVAAQAGNDRTQLTLLPTSGNPAPDPEALTPRGINEAYVISETLSTAGDSVTADVRLVHVPTGQSGSSAEAVTSADETVTLARAAVDKPFALTAMSVGELAAEPIGPHVTHVGVTGTPGARAVEVRFDSDLDPASVNGAVVLLGLDGVRIAAPAGYDATSRTVTLLLPTDAEPLLALGQVKVRVDTTLLDVDGNRLASLYTKTISG